MFLAPKKVLSQIHWYRDISLSWPDPKLTGKRMYTAGSTISIKIHKLGQGENLIFYSIL